MGVQLTEIISSYLNCSITEYDICIIKGTSVEGTWDM